MIKLKEDVSNLVVLAFKILISGAIFLAIISWFFSEEILSLRYQEHISAAAGPFKILMLCFVAIASNYIFGTLLTANGNLKTLNIIAFSGMILNIVLNLILIPKYMVLGSALASLITQIFTSVTQLILSIVHFKFKPNWKLLIQFSVYILMLIFFMQMIYNSDWSLSNKLISALGLFIFLVGITGIINPRSFYLLLRSSRN
jgi:O-antigen/teichoic acid export membrane protein